MTPNWPVPEHDCSLTKRGQVGDRGQRYEVRFIEVESGKERIMGWTERSDGGTLLASAKLWPSARDPWVVDRKTGERMAGEGDRG